MFTLLAQNQIDIDLKDTARNSNIDLPYTNTTNGFGEFVGSILSGLMGIAAVIVLIYLIWGAFDWMSAANEKGKLDSARNKMTGAIIGLVVLASILVLFAFVQSFTGIKVFEFI